jgi:tRNA G10  N-methylase Trm11
MVIGTASSTDDLYTLELRATLEVVSSTSSAERIAADDKERKSGPHFDDARFFTEWFRKKGMIYYFLFKKNHKVTNIQTAELIALLQAYRLDSQEEFHFLSHDRYKEAVRHLVESFQGRADDSSGADYVVSTQYSSIFKNTVALDVMYGSCLVYLPPRARVDLEAICCRSGYIHSCGKNVYVRNIYKADQKEMFDEITAYIPKDKRLLFRPYSHEDFTKSDRRQEDDLKSGLDDVKISMRKYFLGDYQLSSVVEKMRSEFKDRLVIPPPWSYKKDARLINEQRKTGDFDPSHCLFLVMDHSLDLVSAGRGNRHFIICYDQECVNENPFHLFDENKPAWFDHTTLPHTLAGAMINITRPFWPSPPKTNPGPVAIFDPFVGSGTTLLEVCKYNDAVCGGLDLEPISRLLIEDNATFFSDSAALLKDLDAQLEKLLKYVSLPAPAPADATAWELTVEGKKLTTSKKLIELWKEMRGQKTESSEALVAALKDKNVGMLGRLLFYTRLKAIRRHGAAIDTGAETEFQALSEELLHVRWRLRDLIGLRERTEGANSDNHQLRYQGTYSDAISINPLYLRRLLDTLSTDVATVDCFEWKPARMYDVIITDPPYGFNTSEDRIVLADLYGSFLRTAIGSLVDGGQLVIALPDWSHTGRQLPAFVLKDFVINQVLSIAEEFRREVIHTGTQVPRSVGVPPYYWESETALRRAILHFRFRDRPGYRRNISTSSALDNHRQEANVKEEV